MGKLLPYLQELVGKVCILTMPQPSMSKNQESKSGMEAQGVKRWHTLSLVNRSGTSKSGLWIQERLDSAPSVLRCPMMQNEQQLEKIL